MNSPRSMTNAAIRLVKNDRLQNPVQPYCISLHTSNMASVDFIQGAFFKPPVNSDLSLN